MKKQTLTTVAWALVSLGWIATAAAQPQEGGRMRRPGGPDGPGFGPGGAPPMRMLEEQLGLSDDQKAQWKVIRQKEHATTGPLMKAAAEAKEAFDKALESDGADAATVGQAAIAMRNAHRKIEADHKASFDALKAILTPDQVAKLEEMEKHPHRPGPGGPGPDGQGPRHRPGPGAAK